jgi:hypothetical protein
MAINEKSSDPAYQRDSASAAIEFALSNEVGVGGDGLEFLRLWNEGEFDKVREYWPKAPEAVFIGADTQYKPKGS